LRASATSSVCWYRRPRHRSSSSSAWDRMAQK